MLGLDSEVGMGSVSVLGGTDMEEVVLDLGEEGQAGFRQK